MAGRFLTLFDPVSRLTLTVKSPTKRVSFNEKLFWTFIVLVLYLIMSEIPLFGLPQTGIQDPLGAMRVIFASHRGTLMELGIGPIVTAGLILQLLVGANMIECNMSDPDDRSLFTVASKFFSVVMTVFQAGLYWFAGAWGSISLEIGALIFLQLVAAGLLLMLMDEMLQKGWGLGSGISLFIAAGVAQTILWLAFSPLPGLSPDRLLLGAVPAAIQGLLEGRAFAQLLEREGGFPGLLGLFSTVVIFIIVIYLEGVRIELPITYARYRGFRGRFPVKLLYVSNIPVIFASALLANFYLGAQIVWSRFNPLNADPWLNLLGQFNSTTNQPIGGLALYSSPPGSFDRVIADPLHALGYLGLLVALCAGFSLTWMAVGGMGPRDVAKQLIGSGVQIPGFRRTPRTIEDVLKRYIPTVTVLGGIIVGVVAGIADFFNVFGSGTGILLTVGILYQYYQLIARERVSEMYPALRRFLGE